MPTLTRKRKSTSAIDSDLKNKLDSYAEEVRGLIKATLESAVRIGQILIEVKENILPYGEWQNWVDNEFEGNIKHDTAINFMNLAELHAKYSLKYQDGFKKLTLGTLYKLSRSTVDDEVQETVLQLAAEDEPMSENELQLLKRTYRKIKMAEVGLEPEIIKTLEDSSVAENPKEIQALRKLSKKKQQAVAELFSKGETHTTKEAVRILQEEKKTKDQEEEEGAVKVEVAYEGIKTINFHHLGEIRSNSVNLAIVEAPLRTDYVETELNALASELERVLDQGGYAIITVGHKAAMFCGDKLSRLKPLHLLCLRRQPGSSRSIVGSNITSASVFAIFAYKSPYKSPPKMLVDLQTFNEPPADGYLEGLDEVETGIERGFDRFINTLVESGDSVLHVIASNQHFNIRESLKESCINANAKEFLTV